ncbi:nigwaprin-b-like [Pleurodeles waltl]|uniref:nigwaprin-b-like n=1 Tax=Pleurodeles waltl TaxID=8319 RepID=UPI0037099326
MMKTSGAILLLTVLLGLCTVLPVEGEGSPKGKCTVHDGFCPPQPPGHIGIRCIPDITRITCQDDSGCARDEKCCKLFCNQTCMKAMTDSP